MIVFIDGDVGLCCGDDKGLNIIGNVLKEDPVSIYNRGIFQGYRQLMSDGKLTQIEFCKNCQIVLSRLKKVYVDV